MATGRMVSWASCGALAVWLLAGCGGAVAQAPKAAVTPVAQPAEITDVQVSGMGDAVQVTVTTSAKTAYSLVRQTTPPRLFLLLSGAVLVAPNRPIPVHRGAVSEVKASAAGADASVEVFLSAEALYEVEGQGANIVLNITPKAAATAAMPADSPAPVVAAAEATSEQPVITTSAVEEPVVASPRPEIVYPAGPSVLTAITVEKQADGLVVTLQGNRPLKHNYFLVEGRSLVIDIPDADNKVWPMKKKVDDSWVSLIRVGVHEQPKKFIRVVFDLKKIGEHRVEGFQDRIVVSFGAAVLAAPVSATPAAGHEAVMTTLNTVGPVSCRAHEGGARLDIRTAVKPDFTIVDSGDPARIIVEIANANIAEKDTKVVDLSALNLDIIKVSAFPYIKGDAHLVRVVAQLRRPVPFRASVENERVVVDFVKSAAPATASPSVAPAPVAAAASAPPVPVMTPAPAAVATAVPAMVPAKPAAPVAVPATSDSVQPQFTGRRLSLDFKDADVNDILRLISEVSGFNFVAGPEVKGTVSIKLADVPWDLALDLILKTNVPALAQIRESENIVRITTSDKIVDEEQRRRRLEEDKRKTIDAQKDNEPVFKKTFAVSYIETAKLPEFVLKLEKFKSKQGVIQFDDRTKNVIIMDTAEKLVELEQVILSWDAPTPAVLVEARIVQMDSKSGLDLGVQWGMNFVADQAHGNSTKYAFPNTIGIGGTQGDKNYLVNLPSAATAGGIGMSFGHVANTFGLDLKLSAMETLGKSKTLSSPRVLVLHSKTATMQVGVDLPMQATTTSTTGTTSTIEWKKVGIILTVTPSVTNDKHIVMKVKVNNDSKGDNVQTNQGLIFSINKQEAETEVIIADGETTVIGGLFAEFTSGDEAGIPGLWKLPILGWLFKNKSSTLKRSELMIFITPRIVVM